MHLTLHVLSTYELVHRCVCMVVRAQPHGYVFFVHVAGLRVKPMRFLCVYRVCAVVCCELVLL